MLCGFFRLVAVLYCVVCGFVFIVCRLGIRAIHLPSFALALLSIISVCWSGRAFFASFIHSTILPDGHHGNRLRFFGSSVLSTGVVFTVSCGKVCSGCSTLVVLLVVVRGLGCCHGSHCHLFVGLRASLLLLQCHYLLSLCSRPCHHVLHLGFCLVW